jgi:hypothetical protein
VENVGSTEHPLGHVAVVDLDEGVPLRYEDRFAAVLSGRDEIHRPDVNATGHTKTVAGGVLKLLPVSSPVVYEWVAFSQ